MLLAAGADGQQRVGAYWEDVPMRYATLRDMTEFVRLLLEVGGPPDSRAYPTKTTPPSIAAAHGNVEIAEALIDAGASINGLPEARGFLLEAAAWDGRADVVRLLLDRGATPDAAALESAEGNIGKFAPGSERRAGYEQTIALLKTALARP